ncbi:MAG: SDR family oxidoreductase [Sandaracinaceae bacterium]|nr:SDR family oxidoreductase [Sandaracinaceae bacterium]
MSLAGMVRGRGGPSGFGFGSTAEEVTAGLDLSARRVLVTGVNSGLGLESARVLALRGATILGAARTEAKARDALAGLAGEGHEPLACELSEPESVLACVERARRLGPIDVLLCNAGIMALPKRETRHGVELQLFTNHVGHFLLVTGLADRLTPAGRVVMLSSSAHTMAPPEGIRFDDLAYERGYTPWAAYGQSKLANLLFARALAKRLDGERTANAVHPGVIATNLGRHMGVLRFGSALVSWAFMKDVHEGAATQCYVAAHPSLDGVTGEYFADVNVARSSSLGRDEALAERLWQRSIELARELGGAPKIT